MKVLVTGDSHTGTLRKGQKAFENDGVWPHDVKLEIRPLGGGHLTREPFFIDRGDYAEITTPEYRRQFDRLPIAETGAEEIVYGISAPLHSVRIWRHPDWQRFAPSSLQQFGPPLSSGLIRRIILDDQKYVLDLIGILQKAGKRVFVIEPPHPFRHHPALRTTPSELVLHLNSLYRETVRHELRAMEVPVVEMPVRLLEAGFMREDYAQAGDPHHGNAVYGRIMIEEILTFLRKSLGEPARPSVAMASSMQA
jgi:hypothetical protein